MKKRTDPGDREIWEAYHRFHYLCGTDRFSKILARAELVKMIIEVPGDIVDAGAYKGISCIQFAHLLETYQPHSRSRVIAFDTFDASFPRLRGDERKGARHMMGSYDASAFALFSEAVERLGIGHRVEIVRGDIVDTLPRYVCDNPGFRISLLHCDLDAYEPTLATLKTAWPRIVTGGLAVFDEYAVGMWGESDAVDEFLSTLDRRPLLRIPPGNATPTAYCVKG